MTIKQGSSAQPRLPDVRQADLRRVNALCRDLTDCTEWSNLASEFITRVEKCFSAENLAWNEISPDYGCISGWEVTPGYAHTAEEFREPLLAHLPEHPVLTSVGWEGLNKEPLLMSQFVGDSIFRQSGLYREAYRFIDARYQIAFDLGRFFGKPLLFSFNRSGRDFDQREKQLFHLICLRMQEICSHVERRHVLMESRKALLDLLGLDGSDTLGELSSSETVSLAMLIEGNDVGNIAKERGVGRNSQDRMFGRIRERLGLESNLQLRAYFARLKSSL